VKTLNFCFKQNKTSTTCDFKKQKNQNINSNFLDFQVSQSLKKCYYNWKKPCKILKENIKMLEGLKEKEMPSWNSGAQGKKTYHCERKQKLK